MNASNSLSANAIVLAGSGEDMKILVVKRRYPPFAGMWALPGGFAKEDEMPLQTCMRRLLKETGVSVDEKSAVALSPRSKEDRDPRGAIEAQTYLFLLPTHEGVGSGIQTDSIRECGWMKLVNLPELAFDHGAILCEALGLFWKVMPNHEPKTSNHALPEMFSDKMISSKKEIVFFGGSFNPWHKGHQACLDLCPNKNIVVIPDFNPWKGEDKPVSECRWKSFKALAESLKDTPYAVFPGFWGKEQPNPTVDWLPHINASKKELLMGRDSFANILKWKQAEDILSSVQTLFVVPRDTSETIGDDLQEKIKDLNKNLVIHQLGGHDFQHLSSSGIRSKPEPH